MSDLLKSALKKVEETEVPKVSVAALAYSGGLDSSLAVELLRRKYKADKIIPITVDVGQGEEEIQTGIEKAKILKVEPIMIDAKDEFTEEWMAKAILATSEGCMEKPPTTNHPRDPLASLPIPGTRTSTSRIMLKAKPENAMRRMTRTGIRSAR